MFEVAKKVSSKSISLRFKDEEYKFILAQAKRQKLSVTDYFRTLLYKEYIEANKTGTESVRGVKTGNIEVNTDSKKEVIKKVDTEVKKEVNTEANIEVCVDLQEVRKVCKVCGIDKAITDYHISKTDKNSGKVYYKSYCNICAKNK